FQTVSKRVARLKELEEIDFDDVAGSGRTKKELLGMRREKDKLDKTLGGIRDMAKVPSVVWIVDTNKEHLAVDEARKLGVPVVGILDSNCDPDNVAYGIPGNDDAIRSVGLLTRVIADAVAEGIRLRHAGGTTGAEAEAVEEPLAEWEQELLDGAKEEIVPEVVTEEAAVEAVAEVVAEEIAEEAVAEVVAEEIAEEAVAEVVAEEIAEEAVAEVVAEESAEEAVAEVVAEEAAETVAEAPAAPAAKKKK
ncbi:30S ribosomal protein S2, partial [Demequina sp.]|uniref:30S ribosomal protein S2 n=1 Tax=Demequina sp. TaxID=2050685 RepID=UPI0025DD961D